MHWTITTSDFALNKPHVLRTWEEYPRFVGQEEDFWKVPVLDINPFFFLEDKINELLLLRQMVWDDQVSAIYSE